MKSPTHLLVILEPHGERDGRGVRASAPGAKDNDFRGVRHKRPTRHPHCGPLAFNGNSPNPRAKAS